MNFVEAADARTQEYVLRWSADGGQSSNDIVRQQWNFSPPGTISGKQKITGWTCPGVTVLGCLSFPTSAEGKARDR